MPKKRIVTMTVTEIQNKIEENTKAIEEFSAKAKELKKENKSLAKDLETAKVKEQEEAEKKAAEEIIQVIKDSGLTLDEVKELLKK